MGCMIRSMDAGKQTYTIKNLDGTVAARITRTTPKNNSAAAKKLRKLQYNFKQVSARILQAKTSGNAGQTVIMARGKLAQLRQKLRSGEYDEEELAAAILHAEKMVRIAKKKQKHLRAEENAQKGTDSDTEELLKRKEEQAGQGWEVCRGDSDAFDGESGMSEEDLLKQMELLERLMEEAMRAEEEISRTDELTDELSEELLEMDRQMEPEDLELRKKKHRADEMREIVEADMKYLKALFDKWEREKQSNAAAGKMAQSAPDFSGISLELRGGQVAIPEVEIAAPAEGQTVDISV